MLHFFALGNRDRHGLFTEHVHARLDGADGVLAVHVIGQRDIDGIHLPQALVVLVVAEGVVEPVAPGNLATLGPVAAHHSHEP